MKTVEIALDQLLEADWNPNGMGENMLNRLKESLHTYGLVIPLVVRPIRDSFYEVLSGNQRFRAVSSMRFESVPCVIVNLDDVGAMLLAQVLNCIHGEDDLGLKGKLFKKLLETIPPDKILSLLPETTESLKSLSSISEIDMAGHLQAWQQAQAARLKHMQLQLTRQQLETVEEAVSRILPKAKDASFGNPNDRSNAIYLLCRFYLERTKEE